MSSTERLVTGLKMDRVKSVATSPVTRDMVLYLSFLNVIATHLSGLRGVGGTRGEKVEKTRVPDRETHKLPMTSKILRKSQHEGNRITYYGPKEDKYY